MKMQNTHPLFGAAYYLEYMPYDRLEKDMEMMKAAGMNVIRIAESTWSTLEPREGEFDFSYIDRVLDSANREGMQVIIGTPTYAIPSWLEGKDHDVMVTTRSGQRNYGSRQIMNIMNRTFRFHAEHVIHKLVEHTAPDPAVIGFQIDNETKHYGTAGKDVQILFKKYLQDKYKITEKLNHAFGLAYWSNSIDSWEDLPDMTGCINGGLESEFQRFQRKLAAEYLEWQAELVSEYKRADQFITHNFDFEWRKFGADIAQDGYSYGVQPDINHYDASRAVTIAGTDIYHPTQDDLTGAEIAFGGDSIRSLKNDNYLVLECQAQAFKYWTPYPGQLRQQAYSHLASGAESVMYWNWHSIHSGYETYWKGLLSHDLDRNPAYEEACQIGGEWQKIGKQLVHLQKNNKVAIVTDNLSLTAFQWFPIDKDLSYNDVVRWTYDALYEMNVECDVVDIHALDARTLQSGKYEMLITPALYVITEEKCRLLQEFVREGGVLLSTFKSFVANDNLQVYHETQPHILHECFGMSYNQFSEPGKTTVDGHLVTCWMELLKLDGAEMIAGYTHKYWGQYAAITRNHYGKGSAYYVGCYTGKELLKEVYRKAISDTATLSIPELEAPVIIRSGVNGQGSRLHYVFHYSEEDKAIKCPYEKVCDILSDKIYKKGDSIHLTDWDVKILKEMN
ncbi:MAG: beta-galactosidase [Lachnospiraceae bacterium]|nr:beta-galactosidase [Lachnospiraceae bacterium]